MFEHLLFRFFCVHTWGMEWLGHIVILFNLLKNHQTIFCDGLCHFKFYQPCMRVPISLYTSPLSIAALMDVKQYLITVLILHFSSDMERLFKCCLLAICTFSFERYLEISKGLRVLYILWFKFLATYLFYKYFLPVCGLHFY